MIREIYKKMIRLTPASDKLSHFFWGFVFALFGVIAYLVFNVIWLICIPVIVLAGLKEFLDYRGMGRAEWLDFVFGVIPGIVITFLIYFL